MIWAYPDLTLIGILAAVFGALYFLYLVRFYRINKRLKVKKHRLLMKMGLRIVYFLLFLVALAGPSVGNATKEIKQEGKDLFIAIDLSQSMNAADISPSRLQRVKFELKNLIKNFSSDRIGLIIFSSEAFIQCPLTFDQNVLQLHLDGLNTNLVPNYGTDIAAPLALAIQKFHTDENQDPKSKSIVLISDGENFGDNLNNILDQLKDEGIRVFSLGVGTEKGSTIPKGNGVIMDESSNAPAVSKLSSKTLKRIASETNGQYFEISDENQEIPQLISSIEKLEGAVTGSRTVEASANKYFYFLLAALGLAILDMILPLKTISM
ncbi:vWA domain-containing protein [Echinicola vietnamensis]|uniref:von Willebrand factor type A-like protein n=1 Tax=Echinicola vietnamensis (strain DSM 17526 / LMG 23754 / KMM 6221) TaxID=926556 RepID=L0G126_ECHVK|nr:VWA domain-containing protein [Echinicola vietnamensis]AGA79914.1 von Willebrand factor type A-like protein [Echinicola vietnamensis DSM 17526]